MSNSQTFVIVALTGSIAGVVANVKNIDMTDKLAVKAGTDLEALSLVQLTAIYNNASSKSVNKFSCAKAVAIEKVMTALNAMDMEALVKLDPVETEKVKAEADAAPVEPVRKERDSKLQRMKRAFLEQDDDGKYKIWTIKELMEKCIVTEKIAHQYISILRAASDRFVMNIVKDKEAKTFQYQPKEVKARPAANQPLEAAAA